MRNKLSPTFSSAKLKQMLPTVVKVVDDFVSGIRQQIEGGTFDMDAKTLMARLMIDIINACTFGIEPKSLKNPASIFVDIYTNTNPTHGMLALTLMQNAPDLARKLHMRVISDKIEKLFLNFVKESVEYREKNNVNRNDFLSTLIDLKNKKLIKSEHGDELTNLTLNEIAAQTYAFLGPASHTSSTTASFALYELALNEDIQEKLRQEVMYVLERHENKFTLESINDMVYLNQVISETLRLYPVTAMQARRALSDYTVPGYPKYVIRKGMSVILPTSALQRDPEYFPNPDVFNPDNFAPEAAAQRIPLTHLPFSEGPRKCIGMRFALIQLSISLAILLKNFKFSVCDETPIPVKFDRGAMFITAEKLLHLKVDIL